MRVLIAAVTLLLAAPAASRAATPIDYPWCAYYGNAHGGVNCGFVTYAQCREAISGNGGFCAENPFDRGHITTRPKRPRVDR
jgi:hypothetical protein